MKHIGQTPRLTLRETSPLDGNMFYQLNSDPDVIKYTGDAPFDSVADASQFLADYDQFRKYNRGRWAIVERSTKEVLGWCGLKYHADSRETDLGFRLHQKYWNKGYATEASHLALQYGFRRLCLDTVITRAVKENTASLRVIDKLGYEYEHDFDDHGSRCEQHRIDKYSYVLRSPDDMEIKVY